MSIGLTPSTVMRMPPPEYTIMLLRPLPRHCAADADVDVYAFKMPAAFSS